MNNTHIHHHLWPYAVHGSITLIVENTTTEDFEKNIYRSLRQSIAKIIRKFCSIYRHTCLSNDTDAVRADHVIIQSYEEQLDDRRLYVAVFIKDPYRQDIALTNDQFLLALKRHRQQLYQDIKHHINLPTTFFEQTSLDPIWLYGVCLLALLVLVVVILMLITILSKRTIKTNNIDETIQLNKSNQQTRSENNRLLISPPIRLAMEEDETNSSSYYNETDISQTSTSTVAANLPSSSCLLYSSPRTSYFNSAIETAIKHHLHDDEPIPFIDDNLSITHSRKSSACWSDRTSLSSRFGLAWKLNLIRTNSQLQPTTLSNETGGGGGIKRFSYRTMRCTMSPTQQLQFHDEL
ncbi:unnamed protein product [Adineta steineri]|uniref:Uncharacterized protein n=1 Tax=Adineta steineri TaxID=433720 RepID=A0A818IR11_9BILA|nr:unnamed protein product [Adineta steineri]CAF3524008.1 unnamed protein product [Adineta steineri]